MVLGLTDLRLMVPACLVVLLVKITRFTLSFWCVPPQPKVIQGVHAAVDLSQVEIVRFPDISTTNPPNGLFRPSKDKISVIQGAFFRNIVQSAVDAKPRCIYVPQFLQGPFSSGVVSFSHLYFWTTCMQRNHAFFDRPSTISTFHFGSQVIMIVDICGPLSLTDTTLISEASLHLPVIIQTSRFMWVDLQPTIDQIRLNTPSVKWRYLNGGLSIVLHNRGRGKHRKSEDSKAAEFDKFLIQLNHD